MENLKNNNFEIMNQGFTYTYAGRKGKVLEFICQPYDESLFETVDELMAACKADADAMGIPFIFKASIGCQCLDHLKVGDKCQVTFVDDEHVYVNKL